MNENKLRMLFDYQKFAGNKELDDLITETERKYSGMEKNSSGKVELSEDDEELVTAARGMWSDPANPALGVGTGSGMNHAAGGMPVTPGLNKFADGIQFNPELNNAAGIKKTEPAPRDAARRLNMGSEITPGNGGLL